MSKDINMSKGTLPVDEGVSTARRCSTNAGGNSDFASFNQNKRNEPDVPDGDSVSPLSFEIDESCDLPSVVGCEKSFSSSLPALLQNKSNAGRIAMEQRKAVEADNLREAASGNFQLDLESNAIGDLLPDEEELFAGIADGFDLVNLGNSTVEESEEFDLFSSGGGLELDGDAQDSPGSQSDVSKNSINGFSGSVLAYQGTSNGGSGCIIGEHPYGEHPSRTLFVRNINSNVEDAELRALFEHYGAIRTLYTACKHRGFVMISYYDIRSARNAMRALQNKPLRRRKLDIHFSIPKDNPSDKDVNQGTLVVFNLDASVSNEDLRQIFGHYGEVKEIRETPHKRHHKFIEFYDVRAAEAALKALNRSDIAGKRIKLEPSRPGGARRSLMQQHGPESELDDNLFYGFGSPMTVSPPGNLPSWKQFGSPLESSPVRNYNLTTGSIGLNMDKPLPPSGPLRAGTVGNHLGRMGSVDTGFLPMPVKSGSVYRAHSLPDYSNNSLANLKPPLPIPMRSVEVPRNSYDVLDMSQPMSASIDGDYMSFYEQNPGDIRIPGSALRHMKSGTSLSGSQFIWGQPHLPSSAMNGWAGTPPLGHNIHASTPSRSLSHTNAHARSSGSTLPLHRYQLGSAPSAELSFMDKQFGLCAESPDMNHHFGPSSLGPVGVIGNAGSPSSVLSINMNSAHSMLNPGNVGSVGSRFEGASSPNFGMPPFRRNHAFQTGGSDGQVDRGRIRRRESSNIQFDNNRQYQLDIDRILRGEDTRTTLMIKNIPNKYTSKMLLAAIDENHRKTYDFLYLPIDFKNKCNVGYAFINMTSPAHIIPLYQAFNGKKWEKFNSEKVASLAYARIQGKPALVAHFQNSSLMNEDKRCRPILFDSDQPDTGEQSTSDGSMVESSWRGEGNKIADLIDKLKRQSIVEDSVLLENFVKSSS
ncbi:hypothetical protein KP509_39G004300 [Ceratopteris richardii]|uniref:RRM domain-containing protein n=1 Tax=Ceratopteris richardii TaxID=49495 RepID=A0A8T2PXU7_CERRI|nr:hypothetical protein KP509_39G004300 [Ceratopteris richardii]KAH7276375.1 hypothetical protein KP509_39G004300 [Ceratopteris richardii]KAH7276377.1 hypothetical protein KP509_39G004300 [Ceratopteris richardii]